VGAAAWLFFPYGTSPQQIALVLVVYTFSVASVPILAPQFPLFVVFVTLVFAPAIAAVAVQHVDDSWQLATLMAVAMAMIIILGRNYRASFDSVIALKLRTEMLAEQLRAEKAVAEAARQEAEIANRAKTQFFTAASHDLRQPLHAMGLFAEALRQRTHEPEVAQLVNSINESVDALEGLFSQLLDITRIDSGGVEVNPQSFSVGDIFASSACTTSRPAFEKGLGLAFRGGKHVAAGRPAAGRADPAQPGLERDPLHRRRLGAGQRAARRRDGPPSGLGHRPGHRRGGAAARVRGVLPGARARRRRRSASTRRASASAWRSSSACRN
jgi:signal transduction histidine kinase